MTKVSKSKLYMILSHPNLLEKGIFFLIQCINMRKKKHIFRATKKSSTSKGPDLDFFSRILKKV